MSHSISIHISGEEGSDLNCISISISDIRLPFSRNASQQVVVCLQNFFRRTKKTKRNRAIFWRFWKKTWKFSEVQETKYWYEAQKYHIWPNNSIRLVKRKFWKWCDFEGDFPPRCVSMQRNDMLLFCTYCFHPRNACRKNRRLIRETNYWFKRLKRSKFRVLVTTRFLFTV